MSDERPSPKKSTKRRRGVLLTTWMTPTEMEQVRLTATAQDKTVSEFVRELVLARPGESGKSGRLSSSY